MKVNMPVTDHEVFMEEGKPIISKTNLKGQITAVNRTFLEISGFTLDELINKQHNIVRHPDMPSDAFQDLWGTVKSGRPWKGFVKNRVKNGDFYWVHAQVTPITVNGKVTEYMSVRRKPTPDEISGAEKLYAELNANRAPKVSVVDKIKTFLGNASMKNKLLMLMVPIAAVMYFAGVYLTPVQAEIVDLAVIFGILYFWLGNSINKEFSHIREIIGKVAEGKYDNDIVITRNDEIGQVYQSLQSMQLKLEYEMEEAKFKAEDATRIKNALQV